MENNKSKLMSRGSIMDETNELLLELIKEVRELKDLYKESKTKKIIKPRDIGEVIDKFKR